MGVTARPRRVRRSPCPPAHAVTTEAAGEAEKSSARVGKEGGRPRGLAETLTSSGFEGEGLLGHLGKEKRGVSQEAWEPGLSVLP